mmetsp:Transcript_14801/g.25379  ORF Transcript_14801/g.25379 Transcript_14801/m.25379 type:complete len:236 (+) Transcript_14801:46-753(+)
MISIILLITLLSVTNAWLLSDFLDISNEDKPISTTVRVNTAAWAGGKLKFKVPANVQTITVTGDASNLAKYPKETMAVEVSADNTFEKVDMSFAVVAGHKFSAAMKVRAGQWVYVHVMSSYESFAGIVLGLDVEFSERTAAPTSASPHPKPTDQELTYVDRRHHRPHSYHQQRKAGLNTVGLLLVATGLVGCLLLTVCMVCVLKKRSRRNATLRSTGSVMTPSGEPGVYLPPAYN